SPCLTPPPCPLSPVCHPRALHSFPTRRSSDLASRDRTRCSPCMSGTNCPPARSAWQAEYTIPTPIRCASRSTAKGATALPRTPRSEEHTSELQSLRHLVCRLLLAKKKTKQTT